MNQEANGIWAEADAGGTLRLDSLEGLQGAVLEFPEGEPDLEALDDDPDTGVVQWGIDSGAEFDLFWTPSSIDAVPLSEGDAPLASVERGALGLMK